MDDSGEDQYRLPECFGDLEKVFPVGRRGLRETPDDCMYQCPYKTLCLRRAMATRDGVTVKEEMVERGSHSGTIGFLERWSRKKQLHRQKKRLGKQQ